MASTGAPTPRTHALGAWTGRALFVWGGYDDLGVLPADGALYDPSADRWEALATEGAPSPRSDTTAVWTGAEVLFWGGATVDAPGPFPTALPAGGGGRFRLADRRWLPLDDLGAPSARFEASSVWTGVELLVWGGATTGGASSTGGRYRP